MVEVEVSENSIAKEIDVVIIGGGVAAVNVADSISAKNKLAKITIFQKKDTYHTTEQDLQRY